MFDPPGDLVTLSLAGANRDPAVFEDPDAFDVRRPNVNLQVGFAHGPHVCLGMHLARLETRIASIARSHGCPACGSTRPARPSSKGSSSGSRPASGHGGTSWNGARRDTALPGCASDRARRSPPSPSAPAFARQLGRHEIGRGGGAVQFAAPDRTSPLSASEVSNLHGEGSALRPGSASRPDSRSSDGRPSIE